MFRHHHLQRQPQDGVDVVVVVVVVVVVLLVGLMGEHPMMVAVQIPQIQMKIRTVGRND